MQYHTKIVKNTYKDDLALNNVYKYITDKNKTDGLIGGHNVIPDNAVSMMELIQQLYFFDYGDKLIHFILSFSPEMIIDENELFQYAMVIASSFTDHQMVYSVHNDKDHLHIHFMLNPVSFKNGNIIGQAEVKRHLDEKCKILFRA